MTDPSPGRISTAASHKVETPGLPPLFACREAEALDSARLRHARTGESSTILVRDARDQWCAWRSVP